MEMVLKSLSIPELGRVSRASRHLYNATIPFLYRSVELSDGVNFETGDEHDDTPMLLMLGLLVRNTEVARSVQVLAHRCHLPAPKGLYSHITAAVSRDDRTLCLLYRAIANMVNVRTLILSFGHQNIVSALFIGFFGAEKRQHSIERLFVENCLFGDLSKIQGLSNPWGLSTVSLKSLDMTSGQAGGKPQKVALYREVVHLESRYGTIERPTYQCSRDLLPPIEQSSKALGFEDGIYYSLANLQVPVHTCSIYSCPGAAYSVRQADLNSVPKDPSASILFLLSRSVETPTSLTLDRFMYGHLLLQKFIHENANFPNLRALVFNDMSDDKDRGYVKGDDGNWIVDESHFLFCEPWLRFLARHRGLRILGWSLQMIIPYSKLDITESDLLKSTRSRLSKELKTLIIFDDALTDSSEEEGQYSEWMKRTVFFNKFFFPQMTVLKAFRFVGNAVEEELSWATEQMCKSPLQEFSIVGMTYPYDMRWNDTNVGGIDGKLERGFGDIRNRLWWNEFPEELALPFGRRNPDISLIQMLERQYGSTLKTLGIDGYLSAPSLHQPYPEIKLFFQNLCGFTKLSCIKFNFWVLPFINDRQCGPDIHTFWIREHYRKQNFPYEENCACKTCKPPILVEYYDPTFLARRVAEIFGPCLHHEALSASPEGVKIESLILMPWRWTYPARGAQLEDQCLVNELTVWIGEGGIVKRYVGPVSKTEWSRDISRAVFKKGEKEGYDWKPCGKCNDRAGMEVQGEKKFWCWECWHGEEGGRVREGTEEGNVD